MQSSAHRIQTYLHTRYLQHDEVSIPPFTLYLHRTKADPELSAALPNYTSQDDWSASLSDVIRAFEELERVPRVEFIDTFAPTLTPALVRAGFHEACRHTLMVCSPETYRPAPTMPGLSTIVLSRGLQPEDVSEEIHTSELGFDPMQNRFRQPEEDLFNETIETDRAFLLRLNRRPVAAGMFAEIADGITELVGVTTLPQFRRRGFAAYLTGYMTQVAFARNVDLAFLVCEDEELISMYRRVGYQTYGTLLGYQQSQ